MRFFFLVGIIILISCKSEIKNPIERVMTSQKSQIKAVFDAIEDHEVQILFTEIKRQHDTVYFEDHVYQVDDSCYFYPASTVKLPIAILALEKLNTNKLIDRNTVFNLENDSIKTTVSKAIERVFAVSDNTAFNQLFEYLGKDYINLKLKEKGIKGSVSHRLSVANSDDLKTKPLVFYNNNKVVFKTSSHINDPIKPLKLKKLKKGKGFKVGDSLVNAPMDFALKNYLPLTALHGIMKRIMFPQLYPKKAQFHLTENDRNFIKQAMGMLPHEAGYVSKEYHESYVKYLMFGDSKTPIPKHVKIYNKVGRAYGTLTDCAYIINQKTNKEYIITATIHVNENQVFNDNIYEYDTIGLPFLAELGRQLVD